MLLIVEPNLDVQRCYAVQLNRRYMVRDEHFVFAKSYDDVKNAVKTYGTLITNVIVDHELIGSRTGADVLRYLWNHLPNHEFNSVRCSVEPGFGYPFGIKWFSKLELARALDHLLGPVIRTTVNNPFEMRE